MALTRRSAVPAFAIPGYTAPSAIRLAGGATQTITAGGALFETRVGGSTPVPAAISITVGGARVELRAGGATVLNIFIQTLQVGGAAFATGGGGASVIAVTPGRLEMSGGVLSRLGG